MNETYKASGVNIEAGEELVSRIKPLVKTTFNEKVLSEIGLFGGLYEAKFEGYAEPVLVASTDGVGTKLKVAFAANKHDTVGQCLVNHCVNDILTTGARPLFFLDYIGTGQLKPAITTEIIRGISLACKANGCALIGGEMAEMPDVYQTKDYDLVGTIIGVVEREQMLIGRVGKGDVLLGLPSTGLHTNGYSLARKVLLTKYSVTDFIPELNATIGDALLAIHRSYLNVIEPLLADPDLHGLSHITGGGIIGNTSRIVPENLTLKINWQAWEWPPLFKFIQKTGEIDIEEMRRVFNLGIGMIIICAASAVDKFSQVLQKSGEKAVILGEVC